jgi:hypothetical protein
MNKIDFTFTVPKLTPRETSSIATSPPPRPTSYTTSTLTRLNAKASGEGFCGWINQIWQWILRFLGVSTALEATTITGLENRINEGKRIIDNHFQANFIVNANSPRAAIVVVMKYNGQCKVNFSRARDMRNTEVTKALLVDLLTHGESTQTSSDSNKLEINTMLFEKNPDNSFNHNHTDNSINFNTGRRESGCGENPEIDASRALAILQTEIPDQAILRNVGQYLIRQL